MSEYQYYEFLAIDRLLTAEEMSSLRGLGNLTPAQQALAEFLEVDGPAGGCRYGQPGPAE